MASPTQWARAWVNPGSWWWTGRPGLLRFMGSQRVGHDWATGLNWTECRNPGGSVVKKSPANAGWVDRSLVQEDSTLWEETKPHTTTTEPALESPEPQPLKPARPRALFSATREGSQWEARSQQLESGPTPTLLQLEKSPTCSEYPPHPKINTFF